MQSPFPMGSSPLARGLLPDEPRSRRDLRIIPARAGFTRSCSWCSWASWDHPRSRGVYAFSSARVAAFVGSSPLARGLLLEDAVPLRGGRIIPARAGFTPTAASCCAGTRDHPRSRGVYVATMTKVEQRGGSSPLARGLRLLDPPDDRPPGIIPARAGFTTARSGTLPERSDHPRSRGVYAPAQ